MAPGLTVLQLHELAVSAEHDPRRPRLAAATARAECLTTHGSAPTPDYSADIARA